MGADDFHVSADLYKRTRTKREQEVMDKFKKIEHIAYKWEAGEITPERGMEAVFGIVNEEAN